MKKVPRQVSPQEPALSFAAPLRRDGLAETMLEFLVWIESSKGLTLCQAFKPQYDWYIPALTNKTELAHEFLGMKAATPPDNPTMEHLA
jgi:hypothetical protein